MNARRLLDFYDRVADAPDAVPRLRRFVLDLAVRGKLVEQDPADEPALAMLKRVAGGKSDGVKRQKYLAEPDANEFWNIPRNWCRPRVGDILDFRYGKALKASDRTVDGPVPVFGSNGIVGYTTEPLTVRPSVIVGRKGSAGALNKCNGPSWTIDVAYFVEVPSFFDLDFLFVSLTALDLSRLGKGVKPGLSRADAYSKAICVPPPTEQHRIVAKVDELMALCDRLEETRNVREVTRDRLTKSSYARLGGYGAGDVTFRSHARFAVETLSALTARADQIKHLRQTILNLAVQGKLVEQDPSDKPASELLKRIAAEKTNSATFMRRGKRQKPLPVLDLADNPYELPDSWIWVRFPELGKFGRGKSKHRPRNDPVLYADGNYPMIQTGDVANSRGRIKTHAKKYNDIGLAQSMLWPKGTLCITIAANIADSGILEIDACFPDSVVGFVPASIFGSARYFEYFVRTVKDNLLEFAPATAQKNSKRCDYATWISA